MTAGMENKQINLEKNDLNLSWEDGKIEESLSKIYEETIKWVTKEFQWYHRNARKNKSIAVGLRFLTVFFAIISALIPLLQSIQGNNISKIPPELISIMMLLAGGLFTLDKTMGYSSSWMRQIKVKMMIHSSIEEFNLEWQVLKLKSNHANKANKAEAVLLIKSCKALVSKVNGFVGKETNVWIKEFMSSTTELESLLNSKSLTNSVGSLNIEVNAENKLQDDKWEAVLDGVTVNSFIGSSGNINSIPTGHHELEIKAIRQSGNQVVLKKDIFITENAISKEEFKL